ncbi:MAG: MFS transporter, partial [Pseudomonadota bacterium]|nr:MFS transporter [Pseudomonadota bacterium]
RITRWTWRWLREPLRLLVAVLLFTPTIIDPVKEKIAPAIAITALDLMFKVGNNAWRAISDLFMYGMIAFGIYLVFVAIRFPIERASNARKEQAAANQAAARVDKPEDDQPFGGAGDDRYGRPPVPSNPQRMRVDPRL